MQVDCVCVWGGGSNAPDALWVGSIRRTVLACENVGEMFV